MSEMRASALISAIENHDDEIVRRLLREGASPEQYDARGWTALSLAAYFDQRDVVHALLGAGADPNQRSGGGHTALLFAKTVEVAQALLDSGADIHAVANNGSTALQSAVIAANADLAKLLLELGAKVPELMAKSQYWEARGPAYDAVRRVILTHVTVGTIESAMHGADEPRVKVASMGVSPL